MRVRIRSTRFGASAAALVTAAWLGFSSNCTLAQSEIIDELLDKLRDKGVLSDDEYQALKKAREEERLEQRAERRRQALKAAQDTEKEEKAKQERELTQREQTYDDLLKEIRPHLSWLLVPLG